MAEVCFILPPELVPDGAVVERETPYGVVVEQAGVLLRAPGTDPRALIYAAKAAGVRHLLAGDVVQPVSPLLEPGDLVIPADTVDQTRLRPFTFFAGKGYGFIKLDPPFCPVLAERLAEAARALTPRAFRRATYVGIDGPREATEAEQRMYRQWGADVAGPGLLPEAYLARELELHYAAAVAVGPADVLAVLRRAAAGGAAGRAGACACGQAMAGPKAAGLVGEDWRTWLS